MKAVVMAGGAGSRLRPLTIGRPKPMVPIVNKPCIAHILNLLKQHGITEVVVTVQYLANVIQDYFGDGQGLGMDIYYSVEEVLLGTAGSVKKAQEHLDETFIVISGDAVTDFDLQQIIEFHRQKGALATLTLYRVPNPLEYGVIIIDEEGRIRQFLEKPSWGGVISDTVNTGIYALEPKVLDYFEKDEPFDFSKDLFPIMLERRDPLYGYVASGYWCDVGDIGEYMRANNELLEGKARVAELGQHIGGNIWCGEDVEIAPDAQLYGPIYLGNQVKIKGGVVIHGPAAIRDYTIVDNHARIERCIIWRNSYIGEGAQLRGAIVGRQCNLRSKVVVQEGAVIGDNNIIGEGAIIHSNLKIWPEKEIQAGAIVKSSIIWGAQGRRVLFGRYGVTGLVNVDFTPEFTARLGAAYGATLPKGVLVTFNRDPSPTARMLMRPAIGGLPSSGVDVLDLGVQPVPVARYFTRVSNAVGGVHFGLSPYDARVVDILFIDDQGLNISQETERQIEGAFFREDFRRVYLNEIGTTSDASRVRETYIEGFLKAINVKAIKEAKFNLVVDYASAPTADILPHLLDVLNCSVIALNANFDETRISVSPEELEDTLSRLQAISQVVKADLGVRIDVRGESIVMVDNDGRSLSGIDLCAAMTELALSANPGKTVGVPVDMPHVFERIAAKYNGKVVRTGTTIQALMQVSLTEDVVMAGDSKGSFVFPDFQPCVDGLMAIAKLLEFLAVQNRQLADVIIDLPTYYISRGRVTTPWEAKATVMQQLAQKFEDRLSDTVEELRIAFSDQEWVLILSSRDQSYLEIIAEGASQAAADDIVGEYIQLLKTL